LDFLSRSKMVSGTTLVACLAAVCLTCPSVSAWGGLFNRFNPSMLSNLGYGGQGGNYGRELFGVADKNFGEVPTAIEEVLEEEAALEAAKENAKKVHQKEEVCSGKTCTANEHCCEGQVCVDTDETTGTCLPIWGKKQGEVCYKDNDCESGFLCVEDSGLRSCQAPVPGEKGLGDDCSTSSDCNVHKGLCCKLHRRAKSKPKKICSYFTDPQNCIGPVAVNRVYSAMEHTAGEKRISGHPDDFLHLKK
jgi:hypothetical protein